MKLVLLSANYPYGQWGDNCFIVNEISSLAETFDEVVVISTGSGKLRDDIPKGVRVINCPINAKRPIKMLRAGFMSLDREARKADKELKKLYPDIGFFTRFKQIFKHNYAYQCMKEVLERECADADVVYSYWLSSRAYAYARLKRGKGYDNIFISRSHGFDCYLARNAYLPYRSFTCGQLDEIVFISQDGRDAFERETYPVLDKKTSTRVQYLGVNKESEEPDYQPGDTLDIVTCSSITAVKRMDIIIDALSLIDDIKINWVHFGDGDMAEEIKSLACARLDGKSNIKYQFKGNVANSEILEYYRNNKVDLIVNCSDSEGIPVSIMEAFSFGIPAITRDVGGIREINCGEEDGYLLGQDAAAQDFADAIVAYANKGEQQKLQKRGEVRDIFEAKFSIKAISDYCESIKALCDK